MIDIKQGNCLTLMNDIPPHSIDMILCDLPYEITGKHWDIAIPFEDLWAHYKRITKQGGVIALFGRQPFTSAVVQSNLDWWRYELIWEKDKGTDFGNANRKPLNAHENIEIFYNAQPTYNKQMRKGKPYVKKNYRNNDDEDLNFKSDNSGIWINNGQRTPTSVIKIARDNIHKGTNLHPTQKPVQLLEWLIKTYTNKGETVLDNCMGSGSTGVACINTDRNFIGYELDNEYFNIAEKRINNVIELQGEQHE